MRIFGDDGKTPVAILGRNPNDKEMVLILKSPTDNRMVGMMIDEDGGRLDCNNKMGETVVRIGVGSDGSGHLDTRDKYGYTK